MCPRTVKPGSCCKAKSTARHWKWCHCSGITSMLFKHITRGNTQFDSKREKKKHIPAASPWSSQNAQLQLEGNVVLGKYNKSWTCTKSPPFPNHTRSCLQEQRALLPWAQQDPCLHTGMFATPYNRGGKLSKQRILNCSNGSDTKLPNDAPAAASVKDF